MSAQIFPPPTAPPDRSRQEALRALNLLDAAPEDRFDRLTRLARHLFNVSTAMVSLVDGDSEGFAQRLGLAADADAADTDGLDDGLRVVPDTLRDPRYAEHPLVVGVPNIRFYAECPLRLRDGSLLGTLCLLDPVPRTFDAVARGLLRDLATMAEQEVAAVQLATIDELTGIANRRGFMALAEHALRLCRRRGNTAALMYFDLNGFKGINDTFGHTEGDNALVAFAGQLRGVFRDSDVVARIGGDEFVALVTAHDRLAIRAILVRFAASMEAHNLNARLGYDLAYSVGCVDWMADADESIDELLRRADARMFAAKRSGKRSARPSVPEQREEDFQAPAVPVVERRRERVQGMGRG